MTIDDMSDLLPVATPPLMASKVSNRPMPLRQAAAANAAESTLLSEQCRLKVENIHQAACCFRVTARTVLSRQI
ncbi:MAG: hypothetical protein CSB44_01260 [Gammaproteobacteria bacterium]|nr:MAG: hypothetical protein CSB44_01260 [Gammaproteobacteria bacterium]